MRILRLVVLFCTMVAGFANAQSFFPGGQTGISSQWDLIPQTTMALLVADGFALVTVVETTTPSRNPGEDATKSTVYYLQHDKQLAMCSQTYRGGNIETVVAAMKRQKAAEPNQQEVPPLPAEVYPSANYACWMLSAPHQLAMPHLSH